MRTTRLVELTTDPVHLTVSWEEIQQDGEVRTVEASLCREHRGDVSLKYPSARGCGRRGTSCDLCEGRQLRTISAVNKELY